MMGLPSSRRGLRGLLFRASLPVRLPSTWLLRQPSTCQSRRLFLVPSGLPSSSSSHASVLASSTDRPPVNSDGFTLVGGRRSTSAGPRKTIRGKNTVRDNCKLRPMPRRLRSFVWRLHFDTCANDLSKFQEEGYVLNPTCKRLEAKKR